MTKEKITPPEETLRSRQNPLIRHFIALGSDGDYRREQGEYLCAGRKLLDEARRSGARITKLLWTELLPGLPAVTVTEELLRYVSPLKNSDEPVFSVAISPLPAEAPDRVIILENVQDPGNVGTTLRTAEALGFDMAVLVGACADVYHPRTVRATMGAIFRLPVVTAGAGELRSLLPGLKLYAAALAPGALDIRTLPRHRIALAVGNEGQGLTAELIAACDGVTVIPMSGRAESLNAGVAAAVAMWETVRDDK